MNANGKDAPPFHHAFQDDGSSLEAGAIKDVPNAFVRKSRLDESIISDAIDRLAETGEPYRVVVSGPDSYNLHARRLLVDVCGVKPSYVTLLSA